MLWYVRLIRLQVALDTTMNISGIRQQCCSWAQESMHTKQRRVGLRNASCCDSQLWRVFYGWTEVTIVGVDSKAANPGMQAAWPKNTCDLTWKERRLPISVTTYLEGYEDLSFNRHEAHVFAVLLFASFCRYSAVGRLIRAQKFLLSSSQRSLLMVDLLMPAWGNIWGQCSFELDLSRSKSFISQPFRGSAINAWRAKSFA